MSLASALASGLRCVGLGGADLHFFPFFEVFADGFVATRDDFLPFRETRRDLKVVAVTDAVFHRHHLRAVAVTDEDDLNRFAGFQGFFLRLLGFTG